MFFQGTAALSLDAKGRLAIPARHRDALNQLCGGNLVITAHPHGCLSIYPAPTWAPLRDQIMAIPGLDPATGALKRLLVGNARDEEMDASGRVLIAPELRALGRLDRSVRLVGQGRSFELWSEEAWMAQQALATEQFASGVLPTGFASLTL